MTPGEALGVPAAVVPLAADLVRVAGPDALAFLQGQLSQDVADLPVGGSALSFLLQPQGRVVALLRVHRLDETEVLLVADAGTGAAVVERLERFLLRVDATVTPSDAALVAVRGDGAAAVAVPAGATGFTAGWPGLPGLDVVVPGGGRPRLDLPEATAEQWERARIRAAIPRVGAEITERTIPGETLAVPLAVSFTKGCYTGQELVARVDSRGNHVPRLVRRLVADEPVDLPVGADLLDEGGEPVGEVTSAVPGEALAVVSRSVAVPAHARVLGAGGEPVAVRVVAGLDGLGG